MGRLDGAEGGGGGDAASAAEKDAELLPTRISLLQSSALPLSHHHSIMVCACVCVQCYNFENIFSNKNTLPLFE